MCIAREFNRLIYRIGAVSAALMLAVVPLSVQAQLSDQDVHSIVNDILGGQSTNSPQDPPNQHGQQNAADNADHNPCTHYWESAPAEEYCPNATLTFTDPDTCTVEATCTVTAAVMEGDGKWPDEHTTWTVSLDWETTNFQNLYNLTLCFRPDLVMQTYSLHIRPLCEMSAEEVQATYHTGYIDALPAIRSASVE